MAEMNSQARAYSLYELVPNILRYTFNNLYMLQRIWYCYSRYHLVTTNYVTFVRLAAWPTCGVLMHFSQ